MGSLWIWFDTKLILISGPEWITAGKKSDGYQKVDLTSILLDLPCSNLVYRIKGLREGSLLAYTAINLWKFTGAKDHVLYIPLREALRGQNLNTFR